MPATEQNSELRSHYEREGYVPFEDSDEWNRKAEGCNRRTGVVGSEGSGGAG